MHTRTKTNKFLYIHKYIKFFFNAIPPMLEIEFACYILVYISKLSVISGEETQIFELKFGNLIFGNLQIKYKIVFYLSFVLWLLLEEIIP